MNLLVTLDENYILPLKVLMFSLFANNPGESFHIYVLHAGISEGALSELRLMAEGNRSALHAVEVPEEAFADAPVLGHYTKAMYYRLLAYELLPGDLDKILYLDPDILVINPIRALYQKDLTGYLFGAASHTALTPMTRQLNRVRLNAYDTEGYYNSGVLLMNLALQRQRLRAGDIFDYAERHRKKLILPDQDILNLMFWDSILPLDDSLYNFDARKSRVHYVVSSGVKDIDWVLANTVILHFCGRKKPWHKGYANRFEVLYKHYQHKAQRWAPQLKIRGGA